MPIPRYWLCQSLVSAFRIAMVVAVGAVGVMIAHYPMILSGFARIQAGLGDTQLIHYLLEHGYLWVRGVPGHLDFWSPPFFFPAPNVVAYSDALLSVGPPYWLSRTLGASPDVSFGLWMIAMSALNYAAGLLLFRAGLGFGMPAATAGAMLVAFGAPRLNQMCHQQLLPFFFPLLTIFALARLASDRVTPRLVRASYWVLAMAGVVAQMYAGVYLGWFLIVGLGITTVVAVALPSCRGFLLEVVKRDAWTIAVVGALGAVSLGPFMLHYLPAAREVSPQSTTFLRALHPSLGSWFDVSENNWFWGWTAHPGWAGKYPAIEGEHHLGIGFLTPLACLAGLYLGRAWPICRLAGVVASIILVATTYMPADRFALLAAGAIYYCAGGLFHNVDEPRWRAAALAVVVCLLTLIPFPNVYLSVLGLTTILLCFLEIGRMRRCQRCLIAPAIALAALSTKFFGFGLILQGTLLVAPFIAVLAYCFWPRYREIGLGFLALLLLFLLVITSVDKPIALIATLVVAPISLAVTAPRRYRPSSRILFGSLLIAPAALLLFHNHDSLWLAYSPMIPGAVAIRAVGRVVLILIVPAALGLACLVEFLDKGKWAIASWLVVLVCLAEQGGTATTFDSAVNRAAIVRLSSQIDRSRVAFYYHPRAGEPYLLRQLDAMWASLVTGVPTVNGYSGREPPSWQGIFQAGFNPRIDVTRVLTDWERMYAVPSHIQCIDASRR